MTDPDPQRSVTPVAPVGIRPDGLSADGAPDRPWATDPGRTPVSGPPLAGPPVAGLCRACLAPVSTPRGRCTACGSPRVQRHPELHQLSIAHLDCDAFFASIEKRDRPELADRPVIVGGGRRGVVAAACYVARQYGIRSAMPMFKALDACPDAVVIRPDMAKYRQAGLAIRTLMLSLTPLVEPLSIDEAFLDLSGTEAVHGRSPAQSTAWLAREVERQVGVTLSIGLSHNKFLAKLASELDKPRGFAVIGRAETLDFLAPMPVRALWGVGAVLARKLEAEGLRTIADLRLWDERALAARFGDMGRRLHALSRGRDTRPVSPERAVKSVSAETTFDQDLCAMEPLSAALWPLCERVARRLKEKSVAGCSVTLKLKTDRFQTRTRAARLSAPTVLAETLYRAARPLLAREADGMTRFRLIGIGATDLVDAAEADPPDLLDPAATRRKAVEAAMEAVRAKLGHDAIAKGRGLAQASRSGPSGVTGRPTVTDHPGTDPPGTDPPGELADPRSKTITARQR